MSRFFISRKEFNNIAMDYSGNYGYFYALLDKWDAIEAFITYGIRENKDIQYLLDYAIRVGVPYNCKKEYKIRIVINQWLYARTFSKYSLSLHDGKNYKLSLKLRQKARILVKNYYTYIQNNYKGE